MATLVTMAQSASTRLTASSRPPRPISITTASSGSREKARNITSVVNSKYDSDTSPRASSTCSKSGSSASSDSSSPSMRMRSLKRSRCGEVCRPTR